LTRESGALLLPGTTLAALGQGVARPLLSAPGWA